MDLSEVDNCNSSVHKRVAWVDCARVLGILYVCRTHGTLMVAQDALLPEIAVCMFFFLAGYFNTKLGVAHALKRSAIFFVAVFFWSMVTTSISHEGIRFSLGRVWYNMCCLETPMWFIKHMIILLPVGAALNHAPVFWRIVLAATCYILACIDTATLPAIPVPWVAPRVDSYPTYVLFLYLTGGILRAIPLNRLPDALFPGVRKISEHAVWIGIALLIALNWMGMSMSVIPVPQICFIMGIWAFLFISYTFELKFPRAARVVAISGPAVIFIYLSHAFILKALISIYLTNSGEMPPAWVTDAACIVIIAACTLVYRALVGRSRVLDIVLFAR